MLEQHQKHEIMQSWARRKASQQYLKGQLNISSIYEILRGCMGECPVKFIYQILLSCKITLNYIHSVHKRTNLVPILS